MHRFADGLNDGLPRLGWLVAIALFCAALPAEATNYWVGADTQCGYSTIAAALTAASQQLNGSFPKIYIASNQTYTNQALSIAPGQQSHIYLIGGVPNCSTTASSGSTTINGGAGTSVITVRGTINVTLSHLTITGGNDVIGGNDDEGGGIDYAGVGTLTIDNSTIFDNRAENGGGIRVQGNGGTADLYLNENTFVTNNTANATGGGIRIEDNASAHIDADQIWIAQNEVTNGFGGGIAAVGNAYVHLGSSGYHIGSYIGVVSQNTAQYGGGVAAISETTGWAVVDAFAADPNHPVRIEQNRAYHTGGGIYIKPHVSLDSGGTFPASADLAGAEVDSNAAPEGSGIYVDTDSSVGIYERGELHFYSGYCTAGLECNSVSDNRAVDGSDNPTAGSAILAQTQAWVTAEQLSMRGNQGAHAIRVADSLNAPFQLDTCLVADNAVTAELITFGNAAATVNQCTFANNTIGGPAVLRAETGFTLTNSIVAQGSIPTVAYTGTGAGETLDYVLSMETATLGAGQNIIAGDPAFVDPASGDFHLRAISLAVDVAPAGDAADRDLDAMPRDVDLASVDNADGPRDLGAYELQTAFQGCGVSDTIFCNGFENGP